jgi:hypothetical protein
VGWAGRKAEAQWKGEGKSAGKKKDWVERPDGLKVTGKILFQIKFDFLNIPRLWKFAQGDLGGILT